MKLTHLIGAVAITFGLSAGAEAGSVPSYGDAIAAQPNGVAMLTRVRGGHGGHGSPGGMHFSPGGGHGGMHFSPGGHRGMHFSPRGTRVSPGGAYIYRGSPHINRFAGPRFGPRHLGGGQWSGRHGGRHHHRHWRRHGYWWGGPDYYWGGSCYGNCLAAGYSSSYCAVHADDFCW